MTQVPVELIPQEGGELELRLRLNLDSEPFARRRTDDAARQQEVALLRARESQLNSALDDLSQRLGRAQAELNDRSQAYQRLEASYRQRELELEDRCCLLLEMQRELLDALEQAEADAEACAAARPTLGATPQHSVPVTPVQVALPSVAPVASSQSVAGPPEIGPLTQIKQTPVHSAPAMQLLDRPAVEMATPRSTWTRHPTVDPYDHSVELGGGVARFFHRLQLIVGMTPGFARVDMGGISDWDDLPDEWHAEALGLGEPWYRKPLAWVAIAALAVGIGLAFTSGDVGPRLERAFEQRQPLPSYLK